MLLPLNTFQLRPRLGSQLRSNASQFKKRGLQAALAIGLSGLLMGCSDTQTDSQSPAPSAANVSDQAQLKRFADDLQISYQVISNHSNKSCQDGKPESPCFVSELSLSTTQDFAEPGWTIYFSHMAPIRQHNSDTFSIEHINGDLHRLTPTEKFTGFNAGEQTVIELQSDFWHLSETDPMPNYYVVAEGLKPQVIASTRPRLDPETGLELLPFITPMSDADKHFKRNSDDQSRWATAREVWNQNHDAKLIDKGLEAKLIPTPSSVSIAPDGGQLDLSTGLNIELQGFEYSAISVALARLSGFGIEEAEGGVAVHISQRLTREFRPAGSYRLHIGSDAIEISAGDAAGAANALNTLAGLITLGETQVAQLSIDDQPRYEFRGMHVDVARNFHSKEMMLRLLDQMAAYKLNKLHLHLADDEGWRLEIPGLPELTEIGSQRCYDPNEDSCLLPQLGSGPNAGGEINGFYSVYDYLEILKAASARHIQVIPSLDMPGHSRAAIRSMDARYRKLTSLGEHQLAREYLLSDADDATVYSSVQFYSDNTLNVCMPSTYHFIEKVIDELAGLHELAGQPLTRYHIGADETAGAWVDSPVCQQMMADSLERNDGPELKSSDQLGPYFVERVSQMLDRKGIEVAGWGDGMGHVDPANMPARVQSNAWTPLPWGGHKEAHTQANLGWQVIISTPDATYYDSPYQADPKERGFYWATRSISSRKVFDFMPDNLPVHAEFWPDRDGKAFTSDDRVTRDEQGELSHEPMREGMRFAGLQGQLWSETVRSDTQAEYMIYPRLLALAERAWHQAGWEVDYDHAGALYSRDTHHFTEEMRAARDADWNNFANLLGQRELAKLDQAGVFYRLPTVGAHLNDGQLQANSSFPGLGIEYRVADSEWLTYKESAAVNVPVEVRSVAPDGQRKSRSLTISQP